MATSFDPEYEQTVNRINQGLAGLTASRETGERRLKEDYDTASQEASKQNVQSLDTLQERLANQGIRQSGINVAEQGKLYENLQTQIGKLNTQKTRGLEDIASDYAAKQSEYQNQLGQAEAARSARQIEREKEAAAAEAQANAAKAMADQQRQWMADLTAKLTSMSQPTPTPTGQMQPAPPAKQVIQQAIAQTPPPAAKTPQQQIAEIGIKPLDLQKLLQVRGFDPGPIDGIFGQKSQLALARWKQSVGLPATADINQDIYQRLLSSGVGNIAANSITTAGRNYPSSGPARAVMI